MSDILKKIGDAGIIPVIKIDDPENAVPLAKALIDGGLPVAEVTFRTQGADRAIKAINEAFPDMLLGAGTVLTLEQADLAIKSGAKFIVAPGFNPKTAAFCKEKNVPFIPGCTTATEIELALEAGISVLKFFPAEQSGGVAKIKALSGPFGQVQFIPTGGIDLTNLSAYLSFNKIIACGGSFMVKEEFIANKEWAKITELTVQSVNVVLGFEIAHIGINAANEEEARATCAMFGSLFGFVPKEGNSSIFSSTGIEVMKSPYLGKNGHIAIKTNSVKRAMAYLSQKGIKFKEDTAKLDAKTKNINAVYLENEICGFAMHLLQK